MYRVVLLRHGESTWNRENRFTGWVDVDLSAKGVDEAHAAGRLLKDAGYTFDVAYSSLLKRAIRTLWIVQDELDLLWIPVQRSWRLNERHYGALQGLNKAETAARHGEAQVKMWRRSYDVPPPPLTADDPQYPGRDPRYAGLSSADLPLTECLQDTVARFLPYWHETIAPAIRSGQRVVVTAHGNSLRALVKDLDNVSNEDIVELNIPTGIPLVYELDADLKPIRSEYLGDPEAAKKAAEAVARQAGTGARRPGTALVQLAGRHTVTQPDCHPRFRLGAAVARRKKRCSSTRRRPAGPRGLGVPYCPQEYTSRSGCWQSGLPGTRPPGQPTVQSRCRHWHR